MSDSNQVQNSGNINYFIDKLQSLLRKNEEYEKQTVNQILDYLNSMDMRTASQEVRKNFAFQPLSSLRA